MGCIAPRQMGHSGKAFSASSASTVLRIALLAAFSAARRAFSAAAAAAALSSSTSRARRSRWPSANSSSAFSCAALSSSALSSSALSSSAATRAASTFTLYRSVMSEFSDVADINTRLAWGSHSSNMARGEQRRPTPSAVESTGVSRHVCSSAESATAAGLFAWAASASSLADSDCSASRARHSAAVGGVRGPAMLWTLPSSSTSMAGPEACRCAGGGRRGGDAAAAATGPGVPFLGDLGGTGVLLHLSRMGAPPPPRRG